MKKMIMFAVIAIVTMASVFAYELEVFNYNGEDTIVLTEGSQEVIGYLDFNIRKELTHVSQFEGPVEDVVDYAFDIGYEFGLNSEEVYTASFTAVDGSNGHSTAVTVISRSYTDYVEVMDLLVSNM